MARFSLVGLVFLAVASGAPLSNDQSRIIVVTGATGRTGSLVYENLKKDPTFIVRALVRNATTARERLNCTKCDASDGIFVGDGKYQFWKDNTLKFVPEPQILILTQMV